MIFTYYVYILPHFRAINGQINPEDFDWDLISSETSPQNSNKYTRYDEYEKHFNESGHRYKASFRKYHSLSAVCFAIKCLDEINMGKNPNDIDLIYYKYMKECVPSASEFRKGFQKYTLKCSNDNEKFNEIKENDHYIYQEKPNTSNSELSEQDDENYNIMIDCNQDLMEIIVSNIIVLLSLSEIAFYVRSSFLKENQPEFLQDDLIKAFWGHKFLLIRCISSDLFPEFFRKKLDIINNILDYKYMNLINQQSAMARAQTVTLEGIHKADKGILFLTFFVFLDVLITAAEFGKENPISLLLIVLIGLLSGYFAKRYFKI